MRKGAGAARETRNVTVVTFDLTLEGDITEYNALATKMALSQLHGVPVASISLEVVPASVQLRVTIRPADESSAETVRAGIEATTPAQLVQAFGSGATVTAVAVEQAEEEFEATCPTGSWCSVGVTIPCPVNTFNDEVDKSDQGACKACPDNAASPEGSSSVEACRCKLGYYSRPSADDANASSADWQAADTVVECAICPVGSDCVAEGATLATLPLERASMLKVPSLERRSSPNQP